MDKFNKISIRTTFNNDAIPDSYEIKAYQHKLLATKYNKSASQIEIWNYNKQSVLNTIIYTSIDKLTYNTLKYIFISILP
jgi:hypothetical protein